MVQSPLQPQMSYKNAFSTSPFGSMDNFRVELYGIEVFSRQAMAATGELDVAADTVNRAGADSTLSPWLIQHCSNCSMQDRSLSCSRT